MAQNVTAAVAVGNTRWKRLIPVAIIVYIISFMDRTNIGFALNGLHQDLGIDAAQQGLAAGIFFIGYLVLQIPGGHLAEHWSAKKFVGIMVLIWGRAGCPFRIHPGLHPAAGGALLPRRRRGRGTGLRSLY
ncbi:MFS transporter [Arthrobacter sp. FW306-05-C]|uniref:MFS transporter n=1 Tax=Arthrobacter sp. FW306-05-C TaxID=2879620 RepID=UPI0023516026|nr:MFS transporter [Arthrobacter sp. FW306-05-C]